jgi:PKD repeat protein
VILTVGNNTGTKSTSQTVTVLPTSTLTASFTYTPSSPVVGQAIQFTDTSTGNPTSWQWNFGDGASSTSPNPSHSYTTVSSYTVTLTVSNNTGSKSTSRTINVLPSSALTASFTYSPSSPAAGQPVHFTDTSTGSPTSWQWSFGDGATSTTRNPNHTYAAAGPYTVTLTVSAGSNSNSTSQTITVRQSGIITAASPSYADVSAAIAAATSGDTVMVPAGSATWSSQLMITKEIKLIGAGVGSTIITMTGGAYAFAYQPRPGTVTLFRLSGFQFNLNNTAGCFHLINTSSSAAIRYVRIDNNSFLNSSRGVLVDGPVFGVVDNNTMTGRVHMDNYCQDQCGDWAPTAPPAVPGGVDNLYYEDNNITTNDAFATCGHGGRYCYRHNTFNYTGSVGLYPAFDHHGNQTSGVVAGRLTEIYENTINMNGHSVRFWDHRGGTMIAFNNHYNSTGGYDFQIREEYCNSITCNGTVEFQIKASYYWSNYNNGNLFSTGNLSFGQNSSCPINEGTNFWIQRAAFNGTVGMGVGPLASRPTSGLVTGVGWWATDEQKLYRATGTTTWELYYTPYAYPHPLRDIQ